MAEGYGVGAGLQMYSRVEMIVILFSFLIRRTLDAGGLYGVVDVWCW